MQQLKAFNYQRIYTNPAFKPDFVKIHTCYERLFDHYLPSGQRTEGEGEVETFSVPWMTAYVPATARLPWSAIIWPA
jgi:dGTPase